MVRNRDGQSPAGHNRKKGAEVDAIERRRAQVRSAQRNYRRRKDETISSLQHHLKRLDGLIDESNKSLLALSNALVATGILESHPSVAKVLQNAMAKSILLAKENESERSYDLTPLKKADQMEYNDQALDQNFDQRRKSSSDLNELTTTSERPEGTRFDPLGRPLGSSNKSSLDSLFQKSQGSATSILPYFPIFTPLVPRKNRRFDLSQSLIHRCMQNGYRLLSNPIFPSELVQDRFGLELHSRERDNLAALFQYLLQHDEEIYGAHGFWIVEQWYDRHGHRRQNYPHNSSGSLPHGNSKMDWLDVYQVLDLLEENGIICTDAAAYSMVSSLHSGAFPPHRDFRFNPSFNSKSLINEISEACRCSDRGPVFPRRDVERIVRLAAESFMSNGSGGFMFDVFE